jgi:aspartate racemase
MKTIGLIGGMSWESTVTYYQTINREVADQLGGLHSAKIVLISVDFYEIERLQRAGDWETAGRILGQNASAAERAGADFLVLATNTLHLVAPAIQQAVSIGLLHIADATAQVISAAGLNCVGLLGTRYTMEQDFYRGRLEKQFGLTVLTPHDAGREAVHRIIYDELCLGHVRDRSRLHIGNIIEGLVAEGAQAIILGCTELGLLIRAADSAVPLFDTTEIHARAAAQWALDLADSSEGPH